MADGRVHTRPTPALAAWVIPACLVLAGLGITVSGYLFVEHLTAGATLACPANGALDCRRVTTSEQASILGIPWAAIGIAYFAAVLVLTRTSTWRSTSAALVWARLLLTAAGAIAVLYLVFVELFVVDAICLWCTVIHVIALALFGVVAMASPRLASG